MLKKYTFMIEINNLKDKFNFKKKCLFSNFTQEHHEINMDYI